MVRIRAALALALALCGAAAACGESRERQPVRLAVSLPAEAAALERPLTAALAAALAESATFAPEEAAGTPVRGEASLALEGPEGAWVVRVTVEVPTELRPHFVASTISAVATVGPGTREPNDAGLRAATQRAIAGLEAQCRLARDDLGGLDTLLASGEPLQILVAVRYISDRQASALADRLLPLLRDDDPRVRVAVLDALGTVGTPDHAAGIVREAHRLDPGATREAYRALARLGGLDAIGFLRFAAANEDDPELRAEAERALSSALAGRSASAAGGSRGVDLPKVARGHRQ